MAALFAVLTVLVFGGSSHAERRVLERELATHAFHLTPASAVRAVRAYLANEDDMQRCHAYAQAMLGRPYRAYYVRSLAEWQPLFTLGVQQDPDATPLVQPARALAPYRDFLVEYPPGFLVVALVPALFATGEDGYAIAFKMQMALYLALTLVLMRHLARQLQIAPRAQARLGRTFAVAVLALGVVCTHRYDAFIAASVTAALLAAARRRSGLAGMLLGIGVAAKGVPLLVAPLLAAYLQSENREGSARRWLLPYAVGIGAVAGGALAGAWWRFGDGVLAAIAYHGARPVQIESTAGALLALMERLHGGIVTVVHSYSSRNLRGPWVDGVGSASNGLAGVALVAASAWISRRVRRAPDSHTRLAITVDGVVLLFALYDTLGKVFCPQYLVWLLPFAVLAGSLPGRPVPRTRLLLAILLATQVIYPLGYSAVKALAPWASGLVLLRNLGCLAWALTLGWSQAPGSGGAASSLPVVSVVQRGGQAAGLSSAG